MMVEPVIDWDTFFKDMDDGMSAYNLQDKYGLTPRQYRKIKRGISKKSNHSMKRSRTKPYTVRTNFQEPYITFKKDGKFMVRKGKTYYGQYNTLEIAKEVKKRLTQVNWDKTQINKIREDLGLKPMRYTL